MYILFLNSLWNILLYPNNSGSVCSGDYMYKVANYLFLGFAFQLLYVAIKHHTQADQIKPEFVEKTGLEEIFQ